MSHTGEVVHFPSRSKALQLRRMVGEGSELRVIGGGTDSIE